MIDDVIAYIMSMNLGVVVFIVYCIFAGLFMVKMYLDFVKEYEYKPSKLSKIGMVLIFFAGGCLLFPVVLLLVIAMRLYCWVNE